MTARLIFKILVFQDTFHISKDNVGYKIESTVFLHPKMKASTEYELGHLEPLLMMAL
jgi:hypothetical protein